ncbi:plasmid partitioning protein RepB C-terminal domain-containing protein [Paracoccus salsus]|uniref:plasmid partitioning protein RepB C-terminal domain-containing protein n=1 Tax=Paracoccus salsus TaxID=2911061 RepID=UPI001F3FF838|nr:plasmid partitioning protein RepB C-terminal domain-containing protein [Paracoccus salsus]MCF3975013.1 hypothetical protein [Paracoccus salsus]
MGIIWTIIWSKSSRHAFQAPKIAPGSRAVASRANPSRSSFFGIFTCLILAASDATDLVDPATKKPPAGVTREQAERMKAEMANLQKNIKLIEGTLGPDHLRLVVAGRYVERLLQNDRLARYLDKNHGEILGEFRQIVAGLAQPVCSTEAGSNKGA